MMTNNNNENPLNDIVGVVSWNFVFFSRLEYSIVFLKKWKLLFWCLKTNNNTTDYFLCPHTLSKLLTNIIKNKKKNKNYHKILLFCSMCASKELLFDVDRHGTLYIMPYCTLKYVNTTSSIFGRAKGISF